MPCNGTPLRNPAPLPLYLDMTGKRTLVVGGGCVAQRKTETLVAHGCDVTVVSPAASEKLKGFAKAGSITLVQRAFEPQDVLDCFLVFACTDSHETNAAVTAAAQEAGALANCTDCSDPEVFIPAAVARGKLQIAVSTGGASPALAQKIRQELQERFDEAYAPYVDLLGETRKLILEEVEDPKKRHAMNRAALDECFLETIRNGGSPTPRELFAFAERAVSKKTEE